MRCDFCPNEATIEIAVNMNGEMKTLHPCASCYEEKIEDFLQQMPVEWGNQEMVQQLRSLLRQEPVKEDKKREDPSPRDKAYDMQRKALHRQRKDYMRKLETALADENYEDCAFYRDEINRIGDAIVQLNEERKDFHGA